MMLTAGSFQRNTVWSNAVSLWLDAVTHSPFKPRPRMNLARAYQLDGQLDPAIHEYSTVIRLATLPTASKLDRAITRQIAATNVSQMLIQVGEFDKAKQLLVAAWNEDPGFPGLAINLAIVYAHQRNLKMAYEVLDESIRALPNYPWFRESGKIYFNKAVVAALKGDCKDAMSNYSVAALTDPDLPTPQPCL